MKTMNKLFLGLGFCAGLVSCSDFDEVNTNPTAAGEEYVKPQYALNNSIGQAQMNPGTAERVVVYNWASAARICGEMSFLNVGRYSDDYTSSYYYPDLSASIKNATLAINSQRSIFNTGTEIRIIIRRCVIITIAAYVQKTHFSTNSGSTSPIIDYYTFCGTGIHLCLSYRIIQCILRFYIFLTGGCGIGIDFIKVRAGN